MQMQYNDRETVVQQRALQQVPTYNGEVRRGISTCSHCMAGGAAAPAPDLTEGSVVGSESTGTVAFAPTCACSCSAEPSVAPGARTEVSDTPCSALTLQHRELSASRPHTAVHIRSSGSPAHQVQALASHVHCWHVSCRQSAAVAPVTSGEPFIRSIAPDGTVVVKDAATGATVPPAVLAGGRKVIRLQSPSMFLV